LAFFLVRFWAFLGKGSSKHHYKTMSKTFTKKIDKTFDVSFSSFFFVYRVFGCFSAMRVQKHYKNVLQFFSFLQKNRQKIQNRFFLGFVLSPFCAFLGEGS
jgi:hypothetical protein